MKNCSCYICFTDSNFTSEHFKEQTIKIKIKMRYAPFNTPFVELKIDSPSYESKHLTSSVKYEPFS